MNYGKGQKAGGTLPPQPGCGCCKGKKLLLLSPSSSSHLAASLASASNETGLSPSAGTGSGENQLQQQWERQFCSVHGNLLQLYRGDLFSGENWLAQEDEGSFAWFAKAGADDQQFTAPAAVDPFLPAPEMLQEVIALSSQAAPRAEGLYSAFSIQQTETCPKRTEFRREQ